MIKDTQHAIHKLSADVINKLSVPNALYDRLLPRFFSSPNSPSLSSNVSVVSVRVCVRDLVLQPSLIGLELSIDQSGLWAEIKVFLSLDTPVAGWEYRGEVGKIQTVGHIRLFVCTFSALRRVSWLFLLCCGGTNFKFKTVIYYLLMEVPQQELA